ncbi:MAG TPA: MFS transporter [Fimbriimonadaceae bacterium]|nr:MFS transporter [Fimbriimonadaceae bacterium]
MLEVLRHRAFRNLWLGQAISQLGDALYYVVFMFMVKKLTGSAAMVGLVGAVETLPFLLFSAYGGVVADRMDRKKIMLLSDIASGSILVAFSVLAAIYGMSMPVIFVFLAAFFTSVVRAFFLPAKNAAIPALVGKEDIIRANALSYATQSWMPMIGLAISATVIAALFAISPRWFFATAIVLNSVSFFGSAYYIAKLPTILPDRENAHESHPWRDFVDGIRYIGDRGTLKALLWLGLFMSLMISPFFVAYVEANDLWYGGKPGTLAMFELTFFVGLVIGGLLVGKANVKKPGINYVWALAAVGLFVALMAYSRSLLWFGIWNFMAGLVIPFADIPMSSYIQVTVSDEFRGRVNSAFTMVRMGVTPIGLGLGGMIVNGIGLFWTFMVMGLGMLTVALCGLLHKGFRESTMPSMEIEPEPLVLEKQSA